MGGLQRSIDVQPIFCSETLIQLRNSLYHFYTVLPAPATWWLKNAVFKPSDDSLDGVYSRIKLAWEALSFETFAIATFTARNLFVTTTVLWWNPQTWIKAITCSREEFCTYTMPHTTVTSHKRAAAAWNKCKCRERRETGEKQRMVGST
jgi:hypothetical protein